MSDREKKPRDRTYFFERKRSLGYVRCKDCAFLPDIPDGDWLTEYLCSKNKKMISYQNYSSWRKCKRYKPIGEG